MRAKPMLCLDFDGVCHSYSSGWKGPLTIPDPPTRDLADWLSAANEHFRLVVFSSRSNYADGISRMQEWWRAHNLPEVVEWWREKPPALLTIDDRALTFTGNWDDFDPQTLLKFKPWNK